MNLLEEIRLNPERNLLTIRYSEQKYFLPAEFLRVYSPSAEVRGHGIGQEKLQTGKRWVTITDLEMVGNYALKIVFSDGHDSGLYDWHYLYDLAVNQDKLWVDYITRLTIAGETRELDTSIPTQCGNGGCGC